MWKREAAERIKDRPAIVVLATLVRDDLVEVYAAPVTTQAPREPHSAVEIPQRVKAHLGLDDQRCWIVATELNRFIWPGPDVRPVRRKGKSTPYYGKIPARLFEQLRRLMAIHAGRVGIVRRSR